MIDALALMLASDVGSDPVPTPKDLEAVAAVQYGAEGSSAFTILVGGGSDLDGADYAQGIAEYSWFVAEGLGLGLYASGIGVWQPIEDAAGGGVGIDIRWHFLREETWSVYGELGCGVQFTTNEVPANTSDTNFAPWAGIGVRQQLDAGTSLMLGVQWFHQSNARTDEQNPGRDSIGAYVGLSWSL
ncbi:MAG: acyloxyacyl hydrolase [Planctomycetota bacterium]|nr:MAG: acyloxyacyl hydrolase [Planctomycetota bacterium]RLS51963.1 MAG: acyloxyacyl hydrolase [Planctomycetota bacterium]